ncbi:MAG: type II toxin-antitoxin system PemK/MazF family toxin [Thermomicrobiales bacterium]
MRSMTAYSRGDVVLVEFTFSDESGTKLRPALVVSTPPYHRAREEVVVAAITSNVTRRLVGDHMIVDWQQAGLLFPSSVTGIIRTIKRSMIRRKLGSLATHDMDAFDRMLRRSLGL